MTLSRIRERLAQLFWRQNISEWKHRKAKDRRQLKSIPDGSEDYDSDSEDELGTMSRADYSQPPEDDPLASAFRAKVLITQLTFL